MHLLAVSALALGLAAAPTTATKVAYGFAWADGAGKLRILPTSATFSSKSKAFTLKTKKGAKEVRLDYAKAKYGRVALACDLKETEGRVNLDKRGLGKTACTPKDLAAGLAQGPFAVRVEYSGTKATRVNEILTGRWNLKTVEGTVSRLADGTLKFKGQKLGYTWQTSFWRVTAKCGDGWLTGKPVNADRDGLGTKPCTHKDLAKVAKTWKYPVLVQLSYYPVSGQVFELWEVFGDA